MMESIYPPPHLVSTAVDGEVYSRHRQSSAVEAAVDLTDIPGWDYPPPRRPVISAAVLAGTERMRAICDEWSRIPSSDTAGLSKIIARHREEIAAVRRQFAADNNLIFREAPFCECQMSHGSPRRMRAHHGCTFGSAVVDHPEGYWDQHGPAMLICHPYPAPWRSFVERCRAQPDAAGRLLAELGVAVGLVGTPIGAPSWYSPGRTLLVAITRARAPS